MLTADTPRQPYPGLRPFEADEADLFFGREEHVDALLDAPLPLARRGRRRRIGRR